MKQVFLASLEQSCEGVRFQYRYKRKSCNFSEQNQGDIRYEYSYEYIYIIFFFLILSPSQVSSGVFVRFKVLPDNIVKLQGELFQRTISLLLPQIYLTWYQGCVYFVLVIKCSQMLLRNQNYESYVLINGNPFTIETIFKH